MIYVPHCFSNVNTHGWLKLTLSCIDLEFTRLFKFDFTVIRTWMHMDLQHWLHCVLVMYACGVVSACVSILSTYGVIRQNTLYSWQNFILSSMAVYLCNYFWYHQIIDFCFQSWKTICLIQTLWTLPPVQVVIFACCDIIAIKLHDSDQTISQGYRYLWSFLVTFPKMVTRFIRF